MRVKKAGKIILGADLTNDESIALNMEIQKRIAELDRNNTDEVDAIILWVLWDKFDFTPEQLRKFYEEFNPSLNALANRYEMTDKGDEIWLATYKLKDKLGIDIHAWNDEVRAKILPSYGIK